MLHIGKAFLILVSVSAAFAAAQNAQAYDDSFLQKSAGAQFYQEGTAEGKPINEAGCFPTSLAYSMRYQKLIRDPNFSSLLSPSPATDTSIDPVDWIDYFYKSCQTNSSGTSIDDQMPCIRDYYEKSGYQQSWIYRIGPDATSSPDGENFDRAFTIEDVRTYLKAGYSIIMEIEWLAPIAGAPGHWSVYAGHAFAIMGYDYDNAWGDQKIVLKAMDPAKSYYGQSRIYSTLLMENLNQHPNYVIQPPEIDRNYLVTGFDYGPGYEDTARSVQLIIFAPQKL